MHRNAFNMETYRQNTFIHSKIRTQKQGSETKRKENKRIYTQIIGVVGQIKRSGCWFLISTWCVLCTWLLLGTFKNEKSSNVEKCLSFQWNLHHIKAILILMMFGLPTRKFNLLKIKRRFGSLDSKYDMFKYWLQRTEMGY